MKFPSGRLAITEGVNALVTGEDEHAKAKHIGACIAKHINGDWGIIDAEDAAQNDQSLKTGGRVMSVWPLEAGQPEGDQRRLWIITEADRSVTTVLLPDEY